jgi:hypothetical protein
MTKMVEPFTREYEAALAEHSATGGEAELAAAYDLGRLAMANGLGLLEVVEAHRQAAQTLAATPGMRERADQFLLQALAAFDMTQRGFWEAQERVRLEEEVAGKLQAVADGSLAILGRPSSMDRLAELLEQARAVAGLRMRPFTSLVTIRKNWPQRPGPSTNLFTKS